MSVNIEVSGDMDVPAGEPKIPFSLSNLSNISEKIPNFNQFIAQTYKNIRPWTSEFLATSNFKTVGNIQRLSSRVLRNLSYFQSNYLFVFLGLVIYCLLTSPLILIVLAGVFYGCYKIKKIDMPVTLLNRPINTNQQCLLLNCASIPVFYLAGAGAVMFWVIGASCFVISLHASFYNIDALVTEDMEGFLAETV